MKDQTKQQRDAMWIAKALAWIAYAGGVVFADVMFIAMMWSYFPSGFLGLLSIFGSVTLSVSAIGLPLAMHYWVSPGKQFWASVAFWFIDIVALTMNIIVAVGVRNPAGTMDWIVSLADFTPATPVLAVIGWGIIMLLDDEQKMRHALRESSSEMTEFIATKLREEVKSDKMQSLYSARAREIVDSTATSLFGSQEKQKAPSEDVVSRLKYLEEENKRLKAKKILVSPDNEVNGFAQEVIGLPKVTPPTPKH